MARKQTVRPREPRSLQEAVLYFADEDRALAYVVSRRWPDGVTCPTCDRTDVTYLANQRRWKCKGKHPKAQFSAKVGTIFEDSPIPFSKWLPAMWLLANCKNGISSYELAQSIKVTQRTAWFMLSRIRAAMKSGLVTKLSGEGGPVEVDESWIGAKARMMNTKQRRKHHPMHKGGPSAYAGKALVLGMLERGGQVIARAIPNVRKKTLQPLVREHVAKGAELHTDMHDAYFSLPLPVEIPAEGHSLGEYPVDYVHHAVNHQTGEYVRGHIHTNSIESFWSLLKRSIRGTYVSVEPFHLHRYLDEQSFRFNARKAAPEDRLSLAVKGAPGRRLTYQELVGQAGS